MPLESLSLVYLKFAKLNVVWEPSTWETLSFIAFMIMFLIPQLVEPYDMASLFRQLFASVLSHPE